MSYWRVVCLAGGHEQQSHALHAYKRHLEKLTYQHLSADCKGLIAGKYYLPESGGFKADLALRTPEHSQSNSIAERYIGVLVKVVHALVAIKLDTIVEARRDSQKMRVILAIRQCTSLTS